ncbi:MAG: TrbI/VirB10 family protein [Succinivibrio sp.]|nr:TrbI/VirB10 family protein [Succinivibrio sp.]
MEGNNQKLLFNTPSKLNVLKFLLPSGALLIAMLSALYVSEETGKSPAAEKSLPLLAKADVDKMIAEHSRKTDPALGKDVMEKALRALSALQPAAVSRTDNEDVERSDDENSSLDDLEELKQLLLEESMEKRKEQESQNLTYGGEKNDSAIRSSYEQALLAPVRVKINGDSEEHILGNTTLSGSSAPKTSSPLSAYDYLEQNDTENPHDIQLPKNEFYLRQGSVIPAVLLTGINSELPGQISAQVTTDVYDSVNGRKLLIPAGTMIVGQYSSTVSMGQERVMAAFTRLLFSDGRSLNIGAMPGQATDGFSGFDAQVDNHYLKNLYNSVLIGLTSTRTVSSDPHNRASQAESEMANQAGNASAQTLQNNINFTPTLKVSPGALFNIALTRDLYFQGDNR